jgi:hypothetical protein
VHTVEEHKRERVSRDDVRLVDRCQESEQEDQKEKEGQVEALVGRQVEALVVMPHTDRV